MRKNEMVMIPTAPRLGDMPKSEPVPEGVYQVRCDSAKLKHSKKSNKPMAEVQFSIFGPEEAEEHIGRKLFENFMLDGDGLFRLRQFLEATGEGDDFVLEDTDQLVERECEAAVLVEEERVDAETGRKLSARNRVARFLPLT